MRVDGLARKKEHFAHQKVFQWGNMKKIYEIPSFVLVFVKMTMRKNLRASRIHKQANVDDEDDAAIDSLLL